MASTSPEADLTGLLLRWRKGERDALDQLLAALYQPLCRLARSRLAAERSGHTLETGALVHEAFLKLVDMERIEWQDRAHFLAIASRVMRRVLIDHALKRRALKRGGGAIRITGDEEQLPSSDPSETLLELDDLLRRLEAAHPRQARAVELYHFGGLTQQEIATTTGVSQPTVQRDLQFGEAWLARFWKGDPAGWRSS